MVVVVGCADANVCSTITTATMPILVLCLLNPLEVQPRSPARTKEAELRVLAKQSC